MSNKKPFGRMYQEAMEDLARNMKLKKSRLLVLSALLKYCNGTTGQSRPGRKLIMQKAMVSSRTLDDALKELRDRELIVPIAYPNGGYGCATVYSFALPAWSGQVANSTTAKNAGVSNGENEDYPRKNFQQPPQNFPTTPANSAEATEGTERTEDKAAPSRREDWHKAPVPKTDEEQQLFSMWLKQGGYGEAVQELKRWRASQTMAAE